MDSTRVTNIVIQKPRVDDINAQIGYGGYEAQSHLSIGDVDIVVGGANIRPLSEVIAEAEAMEAIAQQAQRVANWLRAVRAPLTYDVSA